MCFVANFMKKCKKTEMQRKDLTIAEKIVVLRKIRKQSPNTNYRLLAETTEVPRHMINREAKKYINGLRIYFN